MKFTYAGGICEEVSVNLQLGMIGERVVSARFNNATIIDMKDLKSSLRYMKREWFGQNGFTVKEGIFWTAFLTYIFPWFLDIAKVYCAIMVCQAFFKERSGGTGDGKTGIQALVHYGKWFIIFSLVPWAVELIDQIGHKMSTDLVQKGLPKSPVSGG